MTKILAVQTSVGKMAKDQDGYNSRYKYFDVNQLLEQLQPLLIKNKLTVTQPLTNINGEPGIKTIVCDIESGEFIEEVVTFSRNDDPQKVGSCITYYRRYALQSFFALQAEDDDGHKATGGKGIATKTHGGDDDKPRFNQEHFEKWRASTEENKPRTPDQMRKHFKVSKEWATKIEDADLDDNVL